MRDNYLPAATQPQRAAETLTPASTGEPGTADGVGVVCEHRGNAEVVHAVTDEDGATGDLLDGLTDGAAHGEVVGDDEEGECAGREDAADGVVVAGVFDADEAGGPAAAFGVLAGEALEGVDVGGLVSDGDDVEGDGGGL